MSLGGLGLRSALRASRAECLQAVVCDSLGRLGELTKDTAGATHALSCGVPDRESNGVRCLQDALDMTGEFQRRGPSWGTTEITLLERRG